MYGNASVKNERCAVWDEARGWVNLRLEFASETQRFDTLLMSFIVFRIQSTQKSDGEEFLFTGAIS